MAVIILLIIAIVYVVNTNNKISKLEKENFSLKQELARLKNNDKEVKLNENIVEEPKAKVVKTLSQEEKIRKEQESKNTGILITGAILIVLSAIVFLTSTWSAIPNLLKTLVIVLLGGVFLGASKIAKNKFNLEKTSNTFFYIAMAYVPICMISCSVFGLFGEFFSIYGPGNLTYLTVVMIITSTIYFINYKIRNSNALLYGSMISQVSAVIIFTLIFENSIKLILTSLLLYNILLMLISKTTSLGKVKFINYMNIVIAYISGFISLFYLYKYDIVILVDLIFLILNFLLLYRKNKKNLLNGYLFSIFLCLIGIYFAEMSMYTETLKVAIEICYIVLVYLIGTIILKLYNDENLLKALMLIAIFSMTGVYFEVCTFDKILVSPVIVSLIQVIMTLVAYVSVKENKIFKYFSYISIMLLIYSCIDSLNVTSDIKLLIPAISTVAITILENNYPKLKDNFSKIFIIVMQIVGYSSLACLESSSKTLFTILFSVYLFYNNTKNNENEMLKIIPLIGMMPTLFFNDLDETTNVILRLSIVTGLTGISVYKNKISIYTIFSGIYLFFTVLDFENDFMILGLFIIWSAVHCYFIESDKSKDLFKAILYFCITALYIRFLNEFGLNEYRAFYMIGITISALVYLKTIIAKYIKDTDIFEYLVLAIIYLWSLMNYNDEKDGMIYVVYLVGLLIFSYNQKYGAVFIITALAILVNAFLLTRVFWFSIPWWVYLLVIGSVLIAFAIKNESDSNKGNLRVGKFIKKIKDNVEK